MWCQMRWKDKLDGLILISAYRRQMIIWSITDWTGKTNPMMFQEAGTMILMCFCRWKRRRDSKALAKNIKKGKQWCWPRAQASGIRHNLHVDHWTLGNRNWDLLKRSATQSHHEILHVTSTPAKSSSKTWPSIKQSSHRDPTTHPTVDWEDHCNPILELVNHQPNHH